MLVPALALNNQWLSRRSAGRFRSLPQPAGAAPTPTPDAAAQGVHRRDERGPGLKEDRRHRGSGRGSPAGRPGAAPEAAAAVEKDQKHVIMAYAAVDHRGRCDVLVAAPAGAVRISSRPTRRGDEGRQVTSSHLIFIPGMIMIGMFLGFILGNRAAKNQFDLQRRREDEREAARAARAAKRAEKTD
jgi:hypothetical protein